MRTLKHVRKNDVSNRTTVLVVHAILYGSKCGVGLPTERNAYIINRRPIPRVDKGPLAEQLTIETGVHCVATTCSNGDNKKLACQCLPRRL